MRNVTAKLVKLYQSAPQETISAGSAWYAEAAREAARIAKANGRSLATVAGVIAALSPRIHWVRNVRVAELAVAGKPVTGVFQANLAKANRILAGARPLGVLSGPKTRAFYRAIMGDTAAAVIDVWMLRAVGFKGSKVTAKVYARIQEWMEAAALAVRTTVASLQAVVWVVVRGRAS